MQKNLLIQRYMCNTSTIGVQVQQSHVQVQYIYSTVHQVCIWCRPPVELTALHEALLSIPEVIANAPPALAARLNDPSDLPAAVLSSLATSSPPSVWLILQTGAAKAHPRWPELSVRVLEAAISQGHACSETEAWYRVIAEHVQRTAQIPPLTFRKLSLEAQMLLANDITLTESEVADVEHTQRQDVTSERGSMQASASQEVANNEPVTAEAALAAALQHKKRRHAAACVLQARLPAYAKRLHELRSRNAALQRAYAWLSRACGALAAANHGGETLQILQLQARAVTLAARAASWRILLNAAAAFWDMLRTCIASPADLPEAGSAVWEKRAEVVGSEDASDVPLWQCKAAEPSLARVICVVLHSVLQCACAMKCNASQLDGEDSSASKVAEPLRVQPGVLALDGVTIAPCSEISFPLGSDAGEQEWFYDIQGLDLVGIHSLFLGGFAALAAQGRNATILALGQAWSDVTCGAFDRTLMPHLIPAAQKLGVGMQPLLGALTGAEQSSTDAVNRLWHIRRAAQKATGVTPPLAALPGRGNPSQRPKSGSSWRTSQSMPSSTQSASPDTIQARIQVGLTSQRCSIYLHCTKYGHFHMPKATVSMQATGTVLMHSPAHFLAHFIARAHILP
jgi:hypothetical protein